MIFKRLLICVGRSANSTTITPLGSHNTAVLIPILYSRQLRPEEINNTHNITQSGSSRASTRTKLILLLLAYLEK
jgi:hypothetical protein